MKRSKKPDRVGSLTSFADVLPGLCQDLALDRKVNEMAVLALWPQQARLIAGEQVALQSKAVRLRKQGYEMVLLVKVASATLASELSFHTMTIKDALNGFQPQTGIRVDKIQLTVGAL